ncbi:MAG: DUF1700 domain-containing protein [Saccharofermentans sp.]|nr:DUF1700 domain-containing protein [Saccharofermentans sp.]
MNRQEYLKKLETSLGSMSYREVKDILAEIDSHFEAGTAKGKSEEELANELGSPEYLARAYIEGTELPKALRKKPEVKEAKTVTDDHVAEKLFVIFFNLLVAVPLWLALLAALFSALILELSVIAGLVALVFALPSFGSFLAAGIAFALAMLFAIIVIGVLLYFGIKYFAVGTKLYIRWNKKIWKSGF